jgi:hypothetical protein
VFENRVLRKTQGPTRDEVTGEWGKLHNEELYDLYSIPNTIRATESSRTKWSKRVARMGNRLAANRILVGRPDGRRQLGRPRRTWEDNIRTNLQKLGGGMHLIDLAHDRNR